MGYLIMNTDEDQPVIMEMTTYIDLDHLLAEHLTIEVEYINYDNPDRDTKSFLVVDDEDTTKLARKLGVEVDDLPRIVGENMAWYREIINADGNDVRECFHEICTRLTDDGCRYRIISHPNKLGQLIF